MGAAGCGAQWRPWQVSLAGAGVGVAAVCPGLQKWWRQYHETGALCAAAGTGLADGVARASAAPQATAMAAAASAIRRVRMGGIILA